MMLAGIRVWWWRRKWRDGRSHHLRRRRLDKKRLFCAVLLAVFLYCCTDHLFVGLPLDSYKGVKVYYNGSELTESWGRHYSPDGYYFGQKWQCVEFVKRFYYQALNHRMPDVMGHARDYFDPRLGQGELNRARGLFQYKNGGDVAPAVDDILVFTRTEYGHVAVVTKVTEKHVEIIQQNVKARSRQKLPLKCRNGRYFVGEDRAPEGWLRLSSSRQFAGG